MKLQRHQTINAAQSSNRIVWDDSAVKNTFLSTIFSRIKNSITRKPRQEETMWLIPRKAANLVASAPIWKALHSTAYQTGLNVILGATNVANAVYNARSIYYEMQRLEGSARSLAWCRLKLKAGQAFVDVILTGLTLASGVGAISGVAVPIVSATKCLIWGAYELFKRNKCITAKNLRSNEALVDPQEAYVALESESGMSHSWNASNTETSTVIIQTMEGITWEPDWDSDEDAQEWQKWNVHVSTVYH